MKKLLLVALALCTASLIAISQRDIDTKVNITETPESYQIEAFYDKAKTKKVQAAVDKSLKDTHLDATMTFDNNMTIYIKAYPGELKIVFDKKKNTPEAFSRIKEIAEDIKEKVK